MLRDVDDAPPRMIKIIVGRVNIQEVFYVPAKVLCHHSAFFRDALSKPSPEGTTNTVVLADEKPWLFAHILLWMYQQDYTFPPKMMFGSILWETLQFMALAHRLQLDPFPAQHFVDHHMKFMDKERVLNKKMIILAYHNPSAKPIATMLAMYTVEEYITAMWTESPFPYAAELRSVEGYAEELIKLVFEAMCGGQAIADHFEGIQFLCPIAGEMKRLRQQNAG